MNNEQLTKNYLMFVGKTELYQKLKHLSGKEKFDKSEVNSLNLLIQFIDRYTALENDETRTQIGAKIFHTLLKSNLEELKSKRDKSNDEYDKKFYNNKIKQLEAAINSLNESGKKLK